MFKITHGLLEFPIASTFVYPTRQGLRGHAFKFHQQRCCTCCRQFAFIIRAGPFWNNLPAEIVNAPSVKFFKAPLDAHWQLLFPEVAIKPTSSHNPFPQHTSIHVKNSHPNDPSNIPPPPHPVVYISLYSFEDQ